MSKNSSSSKKQELPRTPHFSRSQYRFTRKVANKVSSPGFWKLFAALLFILIFYVLFAMLSNRSVERFSFSWLLSIVQNAPSLSDTWIYSTDFLLADWGFSIGSAFISFNWLKTPIEWLFGALRPVFIILQGVAQIFAFLSYFIEIALGLR